MPSLARLTFSPHGLAFDPATGDAFLVNHAALRILQAMQSGAEVGAGELLTDAYHVSPEQAERDVADFRQRLRSLGLL